MHFLPRNSHSMSLINKVIIGDSLSHNIDLIGRAVLELFSGVCDFGQEVGINHYEDVYNFEGGLSDAWSSWDGGLPQVSEEEAFCGRHSLFVSLVYKLSMT